MNIGDQISMLRKRHNLTQAELGRLVGVSSQAVSKWESGGTPDIEMLPHIANVLGVTIDTLFGLEGAERENAADVVARWLSTLPNHQRLSELYRLLMATFPCTYGSKGYSAFLWKDSMKEHLIRDTCYLDGGDSSTWVKSAVETEEGLLLGINGKNFPFYCLLPEPEGGYDKNLAPTDSYRTLFAALAMPGAMELLLCLMSRKNGLYSVGALAKFSGLSQTEAEPALTRLVDCGLIRQSAIETEDGTLPAYTLRDDHGLIPFLYLARWITESDDFWSHGWFDRKRPILAKE